MRDIKFRAKRVSDGSWVYGDLNQHPIHYDCCILENGVINIPVIPETVGQYIGSKDTNGKEIYEGDILPGGRSENCVVGFNHGTFTAWEDKPIGWDIEDFDELPEPTPTALWANVIGNIHENIELLKQ